MHLYEIHYFCCLVFVTSRVCNFMFLYYCDMKDIVELVEGKKSENSLRFCNDNL